MWHCKEKTRYTIICSIEGRYFLRQSGCVLQEYRKFPPSTGYVSSPNFFRDCYFFGVWLLNLAQRMLHLSPRSLNIVHRNPHNNIIKIMIIRIILFLVNCIFMNQNQVGILRCHFHQSICKAALGEQPVHNFVALKRRCKFFGLPLSCKAE